ncbi:unnamed protein product [Pleuronectes platessa]|uniref:Uncharacterized protein n=1 Tax=Pleuronectes platessa TaxID=8262 RepID=A0A9N7VMI3_PLEPL|nr:unnamed protein product [Pleuronectes platessa]
MTSLRGRDLLLPAPANHNLTSSSRNVSGPGRRALRVPHSGDSAIFPGAAPPAVGSELTRDLLILRRSPPGSDGHFKQGRARPAAPGHVTDSERRTWSRGPESRFTGLDRMWSAERRGPAA